MPGRTIAIGDIHGCSAALEAVLDAIRPRPDDTIITLDVCVLTSIIAAIGRIVSILSQTRLSVVSVFKGEILQGIDGSVPAGSRAKPSNQGLDRGATGCTQPMLRPTLAARVEYNP
jgi:hypothetical protein